MNLPKPLNNRLDFLKDERPQKPPPRREYPYKSSNYKNLKQISMNKDVKNKMHAKPLPKNNRFEYLKTETKPPPVKKGFVAMCTRKEWEEGYRPGWMLRSEALPPDNFEVGLKMYKHYVQTGEIVFPKTKNKGDKAKQIGTSFIHSMSKKKGI